MKKMKRYLAGMLAFVMVMTNVCTNVGITAWADESATTGIERVADPATQPQYPNLFANDLSPDGAKNADNSGRVWTDKSVYADGVNLVDGNVASFIKSSDNDFVEVFSALGSAAITKKTPFDLSLILDITSSELHSSPNHAFLGDATNKDLNGIGFYETDKFYSLYDVNGEYNPDPEIKDTNLAEVLKATNELIEKIKGVKQDGSQQDAILKDSRVSVTVFWGTGQEIITLDDSKDVIPKFTGFKIINDENENKAFDFKGGKTPEAELFFTLGNDRQYSYNPLTGELSEYVQSPDGKFSTITTKILGNGGLGGGTNYQGGIVAGMKPLAEEKDVQWGDEGLKRIPAIVILGDGAANHVLVNEDDPDVSNSSDQNPLLTSGNWWNTVGESALADNDNRRKDPESADAFVPDVAAILSAAFYKAAIAKNYGIDSSKVYVYTALIGSEDSVALDPGRYNNSGKEKNAIDVVKKVIKGQSANITIGSRDGYTAKPLSKSRPLTIYIFNPPENISFTGSLPYSVSFNDMKSAIMKVEDGNEIVDYTTGKYRSKDAQNGEKVSDMFSKIFEELTAHYATSPIDKDKPLIFHDPIGQYMTVKDIKSVLLLGKKCNVTESGSKLDEKSGQKYLVKSYAVESDTPITNKAYATGDDIGGVRVELSKIKLEVWTPVTEAGVMDTTDGRHEELLIEIPWQALPVQTVTTANAGAQEIFDTTATPFRVVYTVGPMAGLITPDGEINFEMLDEDYINNHKVEDEAGNDTGEVYFLTNYYEGSEDIAYTDFIPGEGNQYYDGKTDSSRAKVNNDPTCGNATGTLEFSSSQSKSGNNIVTKLGNNGKLSGKPSSSLLVGKIVNPKEGNTIPKNEEFTFKIELGEDHYANKIQRVAVYERTSTDSLNKPCWKKTLETKEITFNGGIGYVTLKHNQAVLIDKIPSGTQFTVTEELTAEQMSNGFTNPPTYTVGGVTGISGETESNHRTVFVATNDYAPSVEVELPGRKTMRDDGGESNVKAGEFSFTVSPAQSNNKDYDPVKEAYRVYNKDGGDIDLFDQIGDGSGLKFIAEGTYTYVIREDTYLDVPGINFDNREFTVTVTVASHEDGTAGLRAFVAADGDMNFVNTYNYNDEVTLSLGGFKVMKNLELEAGDFTFVLEAREAEIEPATTNNAGADRVILNGLTDEEKNQLKHPATPGSADSNGVSAPGKVGDVWANLTTAVKIGTLVTVPSTEETTEVTAESTETEATTEAATESAGTDATQAESDADIDNSGAGDEIAETKAPEDEIPHDEASEVQPEAEADAGTYTVAGEDSDKNADASAAKLPLPVNNFVKNAADGSFLFDPITFTRPGTYHYTIKEVKPVNADMSITYDESPEEITVVVKRDAITGELSIEDVTHDGESLADSDGVYTFNEVKFENEYNPPELDVVKEQQKNGETRTKDPIIVADGNTITYYLSVTNKDPKKTAYDLAIVDPVPGGLEVIEESIGFEKVNSASLEASDGSITITDPHYTVTYDESDGPSGTITWTLSELPAGETWTVWFKVNVPDADSIRTWMNSGYVTTGKYNDPDNPTHDPAFGQETNTVYAGEGVPEVTIEKEQSLNGGKFVKDTLMAQPGDTVTYKLIVKSIGSEDALNVWVEDRVPYGLEFVPGSISDLGELQHDGDGREKIVWHFDKLEGKGMISETAEESFTTADGKQMSVKGTAYRINEEAEGTTKELTFQVKVPEVKGPTFWRNVGTTYYENNPENPKDPKDPDYPYEDIPSNEVKIVEYVPNVTIEKWQSISGGEFTKDKMTVDSGDTVKYKLIVRNTGNATALDVVVKDTVPYEPIPLELVEGSIDKGGRSERDAEGHQVITWNLGNLAPGEETEVNFSVTVPVGNDSMTWTNIGSTNYKNNPQNPDDPDDPNDTSKPRQDIPSNKVVIEKHPTQPDNPPPTPDNPPPTPDNPDTPDNPPSNPRNPENPGPGPDPGDNPPPPEITTITDDPTPLGDLTNIDDEDVPLAFLAPVTGDEKPVGAAALFGLIALGMMGVFGILAFKKEDEDA